MKRPALPKRRSYLKRKTRPKSRNPKRAAENFARCYGSAERVEFVDGLPCAACGVRGFSVSAHLLGNDGMSRKGNADEIGPLCTNHADAMTGRFVTGCHQLYDEHQEQFRQRFPQFNALQVAMDTEVAWRRKQDAEAQQRSWF